MAALFDSVTLVPAPEPRRSSIARRLYKAASGDDFKPTSADMRVEITRHLNSLRPDIILEIAANSLPNLPRDLPVPVVIDAIDEPMLRELRAVRIGPLRNRLSHAYRAWRFWRYERTEQGRAAVCIFVAEPDARLYQTFFPRRSVAVVPNGVDIEYFRPMAAPSPARETIVFEGNMNFGANEDAARRLVSDVLPLVHHHIPSVQVVLVGRDPSPAVTALAGPKVEVTGTVPDVRPYLAEASVFACPMRLGSGIKNKILQAWSMGKPVVATSQSLGGLSARNGDNLLVRDDPDSFAKALCDVIHDHALANRLGASGRATVEKEYSWQQQSSRFEECLQSAAGDARASVLQRHSALSGAQGNP